MKVRFYSLLLIAVLSLTGFTASGFSAETKDQRTNTPSFNVVSAGYMLLPSSTTEWCTVSLADRTSNLNVRNGNGKVVTKLRDGASVYVDTYDGGFARVSIRRRGKLVILGWVASEYLAC